MDHTSKYLYRRIELFSNGFRSSYYNDLPLFTCIVDRYILKSAVSMVAGEALRMWHLVDPHVIQNAVREKIDANNEKYYCKDLKAVRTLLDEYIYQTACSLYAPCESAEEVEEEKVVHRVDIIFDVDRQLVWKWNVSGGVSSVLDAVAVSVVPLGSLMVNPRTGKYFKVIDVQPGLTRWPVGYHSSDIINHPLLDPNLPWSILTIECNISSASYTVSGCSGAWYPVTSRMRINHGTWEIDFNDVLGYKTPDSVTVSIARDTSVDVLYITLFRADFISNFSGAAVRVKGSGSSFTPIPCTLYLTMGPYTFEFLQDAEHWPVADVSADLNTGLTFDIKYLLKILDVTVSSTGTKTPAKARIDNGDWKALTAVFQLKPGSYTVNFSDEFGGVTPLPRDILVTDKNLSVSASYLPKMHNLTINSSLAGTQARIANVVGWTTLPTVLTLQESNYTIDFSTVSNYATPVSQTITLDRDYVVTGDYGKQIHSVTFNGKQYMNGFPQISGVSDAFLINTSEGKTISVYGKISKTPNEADCFASFKTPVTMNLEEGDYYTFGEQKQLFYSDPPVTGPINYTNIGNLNAPITSDLHYISMSSPIKTTVPSVVSAVGSAFTANNVGVSTEVKNVYDAVYLYRSNLIASLKAFAKIKFINGAVVQCSFDVRTDQLWYFKGERTGEEHYTSYMYNPSSPNVDFGQVPAGLGAIRGSANNGADFTPPPDKLITITEQDAGKAFTAEGIFIAKREIYYTVAFHLSAASQAGAYSYAVGATGQGVNSGGQTVPKTGGPVSFSLAGGYGYKFYTVRWQGSVQLPTPPPANFLVYEEICLGRNHQLTIG